MSQTSLSLPSSFSSMLPRCAAAFSLANLSLNSPSPSMPTSGMFDVFAEPSAQAFSFRFHRSPPSLPSSFHPLPLFTCFLAFFSFDSKINLYLKAVRTGNAAVGVRGTDTIVLGVKKRSTAKLLDSRGLFVALDRAVWLVFSVLLSKRVVWVKLMTLHIAGLQQQNRAITSICGLRNRKKD